MRQYPRLRPCAISHLKDPRIHVLSHQSASNLHGHTLDRQHDPNRSLELRSSSSSHPHLVRVEVHFPNTPSQIILHLFNTPIISLLTTFTLHMLEQPTHEEKPSTAFWAFVLVMIVICGVVLMLIALVGK